MVSHALHSFFASTFPVALHIHTSDEESAAAVVAITVLSDNAKGLSPASSISDKRRLRDARHKRKVHALYTASHASPSSITENLGGGLSRWESELPNLSSLILSPPALPRRSRTVSSAMLSGSSEENAKAVDLTDRTGAPTVPRRTQSYIYLPEDLGTTSPPPSLSRRPRKSSAEMQSLEGSSLWRIESPAVSVATKAAKLDPAACEPRDSLKSLVSHQASVKDAPRLPRRMRSIELSEGETKEVFLFSSLSSSIHTALDEMK